MRWPGEGLEVSNEQIVNKMWIRNHTAASDQVTFETLKAIVTGKLSLSVMVHDCFAMSEFSEISMYGIYLIIVLRSDLLFL